MARDALALHDGGEVDLILHLLIGVDHSRWHRDAEVLLAFENGDPVVALQADFAFATPDGAHGGGGVAFSEDVGDVILRHELAHLALLEATIKKGRTGSHAR